MEFSAKKESVLFVNERLLNGSERDRVLKFVAYLREAFDLPEGFRMHSVNSFPSNCGLGSSTSAFAALALASVTAAKRQITGEMLGCIAGRGSLTAGSSVIGGISCSRPGTRGVHAQPFRELHPEKLPIKVVGVAIQSKRICEEIHRQARGSPLYSVIDQIVEVQASNVIEAMGASDWASVGELVETNVALNHALISTGPTRLSVWTPLTMAVMDKVKQLRNRTKARGFYALNSGPSIFVYVHREDADRVKEHLARFGLPLFESRIGGGAIPTEHHLF